jgi:SsrA-binding protein
MKNKPEHHILAQNRKARHEYEILESFEAGIALSGTEVKSLRDGGGQLTDTFILVRHGEAWLHGLHIRPYSHGNRNNLESDRIRKLLLHRKQIRYIADKVAQTGLTCIPLSLYLNDNSLVKVEIAIVRGKHTYDKRQSLAKRDSQRELERALKERQTV